MKDLNIGRGAWVTFRAPKHSERCAFVINIAGLSERDARGFSKFRSENIEVSFKERDKLAGWLMNQIDGIKDEEME